jgi:hypothetical protein
MHDQETRKGLKDGVPGRSTRNQLQLPYLYKLKIKSTGMNPRESSGLKFRSKLLGINQNTSTPQWG